MSTTTKPEIEPMHPEALYLQIYTSERETCQTLTFLARNLRRLIDREAEKLARFNAAWHDDESPECADEHARFHAPAIVQFPRESRDKVAMDLIARFLEIENENEASANASK